MIRKDEIRIIFLLSIRSRYIIENIKNKQNDIKANIKSVIILPCLHRKRFLRKYQNATDNNKQKDERQIAFIILILLLILFNNTFIINNIILLYYLLL